MRRTGKDSLQSWIVCLGCLWITLFYFAFHRTSNIIFPVLTRHYDFTRKMAYDMVGTLIMTSCLSGIVAAYLTRWISGRVIVTFSILLAFVGLFQLYFSISFPSVIILAALYGIGRGTLNNQLPVILSKHFDVHRTKAVGIYRAGFCFTGFIFSTITYPLIEEFGLKGCFLIMSGCILNALVGVILLKENIVSEEEPTLMEKVDKIVITTNNNVKNGRSVSQLSINQNGEEQNKRHSHYSTRSRRSSIASSILENAANNEHLLLSEMPLKAEVVGSEMMPTVANGNTLQKVVEEPVLGTMDVLRNIMFYPLLMNSLNLYLQFNVFAVLLDVAQDKGVRPQEAAYLNLIFSVFELVAYLTVGFITKEERGRTRNFQIFCQIACGAVAIMYAFATTFMHFAVLTAINAYMTGSMLLLNVILMRQYLGESLFARALGLSHLTGVLTYFVISPLISYYRDVYRSYDPFLIQIGVTCIGFSFFWLLEIFYQRRNRKQDGHVRVPTSEPA